LAAVLGRLAEEGLAAKLEAATHAGRHVHRAPPKEERRDEGRGVMPRAGLGVGGFHRWLGDRDSLPRRTTDTTSLISPHERQGSSRR
jgi:hypothetical protein